MPCLLLLLCLLPAACSAAEPPLPAMSFLPAERLAAADGALQMDGHVTVRAFSRSPQLQPDLLLGDGNGRIWWLQNKSSAATIQFAAPQAVIAADRSQWGSGYSGAVLFDINDDGNMDLLVAHSDNLISIHPNTASNTAPRYAAESLQVRVQQGCQGRFDVADWDGDGLADLITGSFSGPVMWHRNVGSRSSPAFAEAQPFNDISAAYNSHPRIVDFDHDGRPDLLLGINWGTVTLYRHTGSQQQLSNGRQLQWSTGGTLNIRDLNSDDTTPEVSDLNGDGVVDLLSGGKNGQLFLMRGVSALDRSADFRRLLHTASNPQPAAIAADSSLREGLFSALAAIQADLNAGLLSRGSREQLFQQLAPLAAQYPQLLQRQQLDAKQHSAAIMLAGRYWAVLLETLPPDREHWVRVANALEFRGGYRQLLIDLGLLFVDNNTASAEHLEAMYRLLIAMPRNVWKVRTVTVAGWLGPDVSKYPLGASSGVNIFDLPLGRPENSFPADSPRPGITDVYLICLAHEIAHNMLDTVGRELRPELFTRKYAALAQAAGPLVVFHNPVTRGVNLPATQQKFREAGQWDGDPQSWNEAWKNYFAATERFQKGYSRGNIQFFLDAPQEGFSTLANQYFADTQLMLEFCVARWEQGHRGNINQFLLIAEYLSAGQDVLPLYRLVPGGTLELGSGRIVRDREQRIARLQLGPVQAVFEYDEHDLVTSLTVAGQ